MEFDNNETVLDVINDRLHTLNAKSFILRIAFLGEHEFENKKTFAEKYKVVIDKINCSYCDVTINGVILLYNRLFYVICEGSENTIVRQINSIFSEFGPLIGKAKLLFVYHNVRERRFFTWTSVYAEPMEEKREFKSNTSADHIEYFQECIEKLKYLNEILNGKCHEIESNYKDFPDCDLTNYILCSPFTMDLKDYASMYLNLIDYSYCFENSWPAPYDFTPYLETTEMQKTYVELLSNIDDFFTEKENCMADDDTMKEDNKEELNEEAISVSFPVLGEVKSEQVLKENKTLTTQLSLDESKLVREIKIFEKMSINRESIREESSQEDLEDDNHIEIDEKRNLQQEIKGSANLRARLSLDENILAKEIQTLVDGGMGRDNNESAENANLEKYENEMNIRDNVITLTKQLSLDESKLVRGCFYRENMEEDSDKNLMITYEGEKIAETFDDLGKKNSEANNDDEQAKVDDEDDNHIEVDEKSNLQQEIKGSANLRARLSLDENILAKEIQILEDGGMDRDNNESEEYAYLEQYENEMNIRDNVITLTKQLSLDESKLVRGCLYRDNMEEDSNKNLMNIYEGEEIAETFDDLEKKNSEANYDDEQAKVDDEDDKHIEVDEKSNLQQEIKGSANLRARLSLDENILAKKIQILVDGGMDRDNNESEEYANLKQYENEMNIMDNVITLTKQLSLDESKLVRGCLYRENVEEDSDKNLMNTYEEEEIEETFDDLEKKNNEANDDEQ